MITNTKELIEAWPLFTDEQRADLLLAVSTRGKNKGFLLASAPGVQKSPGVKQVGKWAAWQALVSNLAPARVSLWGIVFAEDKERFLELERATDNKNFRDCLNAIEPANRWNLWHFHVPASLHCHWAEVVTDVVAKVQELENIRLAKAYAVEAGQQDLFAS